MELILVCELRWQLYKISAGIFVNVSMHSCGKSIYSMGIANQKNYGKNCAVNYKFWSYFDWDQTNDKIHFIGACIRTDGNMQRERDA